MNSSSKEEGNYFSKSPKYQFVTEQRLKIKFQASSGAKMDPRTLKLKP